MRDSWACRLRLMAACACLLLTSLSARAAGLPGKDGRLVVVRGIGWSPWHETEHWNLSAATRKRDRDLLHGAHINTLRSWGSVKPATISSRLADGLYTIPTFHCRQGLAAEFSDGTKKGFAPGDPATRQAFAELVERQAEPMRGQEGCLAVLVGNEYSGVGYNPTAKGYQYKGFEAPTQARFRQWLGQRFGRIAALNETCGTKFASFAEVRPLANRRCRYEYWLFQNRSFEAFMRAAHEAAKRGAPDRPTSYAKLMGTHWDPYTEDARLSFLDVGGDNLYWHWVKDWGRYNSFLDDLIAAAEGKPVLLTEGGFQSLVLGEQRAARLTKQMLWNAFLHPEVVGCCVYAYSDEWYVDGKPEAQAKGESWGIVTAGRRPKASYYALAEVYGAIEQLNDFFATCQAPPVVAVSNEALGRLVADEGPGLFLQISRLLYSSGIAFKSVMPADLYRLRPETTPRLIFTDRLFDCEPDGSRSALAAFLGYVAAGGQVLYLSSRPWQLPYGKAEVPPQLRFALDRPEMAVVRCGRGTVRFLPREEFAAQELRTLVLGFLEETGAPRPLSIVGVTPKRQRQDVFCRLLTSGRRRIVIVVNEGEASLHSVRLTVREATSARVLFSDGARLTSVLPKAGALQLRLRDLDTYALVEVSD